MPDARELETQPQTSSPTRSAMTRILRCRASCTAIPTACCSKLTQICAVYCRFCFRRETVGNTGVARSRGALDGALDYIRDAPRDLGGDPHRRRSAGALGTAAARGDARARFNRPRQGHPHPHPRAQSSSRSRISVEVVRALKVKGKAVYVALHVNHPRELTRQVRATVARLADAGIPLLGQSVLLEGVNDTPQVTGRR